MSDKNATVAVYDTHAQAEVAIKKLQQEGVDMRLLSIVGKDYHTEEHVVGYYNTTERMQAWGRRGAFWGGVWGVLFGSAFFWVPGVGPVLVGGPIIAMILAGLEGAVVMAGFSALGAALSSIGIPKDSIVQYQAELKAGKYLLVIHGTPTEVQHALALLARAEIEPSRPSNSITCETGELVEA